MINQEFVQENYRQEISENFITLRDETQVAVRLVEFGDVEHIQEMHERLSRDSIYYRYLGPNKPSRKDLIYQCSLDGGPGLAIVATVCGYQEKIIAIACYRGATSNPDTVEPAIVVEDAYQGLGLGKRLLGILFEQAAQRGVKKIVSHIHPTNHPILHLVQTCGLPYESKYNQGLREIRLHIK